jgi:hypothetical protein
MAWPKIKEIDLVALIIGVLGLALEFGWLFLLSGIPTIPAAATNQILGVVLLVSAFVIYWSSHRRGG